MAGRWLLVDPESILRWAWHALSPRRARDGQSTHAVHGLAATLLRALDQERPARIVAAWESAPPTWRHEQFPAYQAEREPDDVDLIGQRALGEAFVAALGWPSVRVDGHAARDVLATLAAQAGDDEVLLLSADRDLCQLVSPSVTLLAPRPGDLERFDEPAVAARYGVPPVLWAELRALDGDHGNSLPGVPGIGEKTAAGWLLRHRGLEGVLAADLGGKRGAETKARADQVRAVLAVVRLRTDSPVAVPAGGWPRPTPQAERLSALLTEWDFHDLLRRLTPRLLAPPGEIAYRRAADEATVALVVDALAAGRVAGLAAGEKGLAVSPARADAWYVPADLAAPVVSALAEGRARLVAHDLTRLPAWLARALPAAVGDSHLALWLLDPERPPMGVVEAGRRWLGLVAESPDDLPREPAALCLEADWTRRLEPTLRAELEDRHMGRLYRTSELATVQAVAALAARGAHTAAGREPLALRRAAGSSGRWEVARPAREHLAAELLPDEGGVLLSAVYRDPAIWLVAGLSGDRELATALAAAPSAAVAVAAALWGRAPDSVTPEQRQRAAALNGAAARGGDLAWLRRRLGVDEAEARALGRAWEARFPVSARWRADIAASARREGWLTTLAGRRLRAGSTERVALARQVAEAALGDLLNRALQACRGHAVLPLRHGWLVGVAAGEAAAAAAEIERAWPTLAGLDVSQPVTVSAPDSP
ncbi:MAG: hypothetical protein HZB16_05190 [Armatimonadetes bacterium]|nr:hypothetical protein [Armatimonadota bacterium]